MNEKLSPERAVRLLRAKAAELENLVKNGDASNIALIAPRYILDLAADIALIASLLADHLDGEGGEPHAGKWG